MLLLITFDRQLDILLLTLCSFSGWLDDIGLPQYKTQFDEGRVDGRMLHYMTVVSVRETRCLHRRRGERGLTTPVPSHIRIIAYRF